MQYSELIFCVIFARASRLPALLCIALGASLLNRAAADQIIYDDALENGWQNWSYSTTLNFANTSPVHSGGDSISMAVTNAWGGLQLYHPDMDSTPYSSLSFWINGGPTGGQHLQLYGLLDAGGSPNQSQASRVQISSISANTWQQVIVSLTSLDVANATNFTGFAIQDASGTTEPTCYIDDISLLSTNSSGSGASNGTNAPVTLTVDALANRIPISPMIYGVAFADSNQLSDLNFTMNRSGGNNETRYNWLISAHNLDADWYFESYPDSDPTPGSSTDSHIANSLAGGAQPLITIPMIGWVPKLGTNRTIIWSYSVAKYGAQKSVDAQWHPDAGNGILASTSLPITNNDPNDANFPTNVAFQIPYVQHLISRWGNSTNGGVRYYIMDNEHSLWFSTHQDVHPIGPTMQELWSKMLSTASMVKSNDPNALIIGPEEWGWPGYFYSGFDQQWSGQHGDYNPADYPDRQTNGGWDYIPWLLNQFHQHDTNTHQRLLDYCTVHCYPQEANVGGNAVDPATEIVRNQSTRQFWDPGYTDPSWINSVIDLIPRLKGWVASYYPGTKIGVTEYNWGAESFINGATAQADILGIFGREGLDLATRWTTPAANTPTYLAMKIYRNYDGNKSTFGDASIQTTVPNPDILSAFGAVRSSDGALTLMVINKDITNASPFTASITNFNATGTVQRWQLTAANVITPLSAITITNDVLNDTVPSQSITLYVIPTLNSFHLHAAPMPTPGQISLQLNGQPGFKYVLQSSTDLSHWTSFNTNTLSGNVWSVSVIATNSVAQFFRSVWQP